MTEKKQDLQKVYSFDQVGNELLLLVNKKAKKVVKIQRKEVRVKK